MPMDRKQRCRRTPLAIRMARLEQEARRRARRQRGQVLVMVAFGMVVLLGITGAAIDLGFGFAHRRQVENAAEAAALAGAKALARHVEYVQITDPAAEIPASVIISLFGSPAVDLYDDTSLIWQEMQSAAPAAVPPFPSPASTPNWPSSTGNTLQAWYIVPATDPSTAPNGIESTRIDGVAGAPPSAAVGVRVEAKLRTRTFFSRILGSCCDHVDVFATARGVLKPIAGNGPGEGGPFIMCAAGPLPTATPIAALAPSRSMHLLAAPYAAAAIVGARGSAGGVLAAPPAAPKPTRTASPTLPPTSTQPPTPTPTLIPTATPSPSMGAWLVGPTPNPTRTGVDIIITATPGTPVVDTDRWAGSVFRLHDNQLDNHEASCGAGNAYKGLEQPSDTCNPPGVLPCELDGTTGTRAGPARGLVDGLNSCSTTLTGCAIVIPLTTNYQGTRNCSNTTCPFNIVAYACFYLFEVDANTHDGTLLPACASSGEAGSGTIDPDTSGAFTYKLVEDCRDPAANTCVY
jgi:hypothetical protein